jgi:hypothetical protein
VLVRAMVWHRPDGVFALPLDDCLPPDGGPGRWTDGAAVLPDLTGGGLLDVDIAAAPLHWIAPERREACIRNR